jgi:hypothetical protein
MSYILAIIFGIVQAHVDAGRAVRHGWRLWLLRAIGYGTPIALAAYFTGYSPIFAVIGGAAAFAIAHRLYYNYLRYDSWDYISTSNGYDRFFLGTFGDMGGVLAYVYEAITITICVILQ